MHSSAIATVFAATARPWAKPIADRRRRGDWPDLAGFLQRRTLFRHDTVAAELFGFIERLVGAPDQLLESFAVDIAADADRDCNRSELGVRAFLSQPTGRNGLADILGDRNGVADGGIG